MGEEAVNLITRDQQTIKAQRVQIEELQEGLRQARDSLVPALLFPVAWDLKPMQERVLAALSRAPGGLLTRDQIFIVMGSKATEADNLVKVQMNYLRAAIQRFGIKIVTKKFVGYWMPEESRAFVKATLARVRDESAKMESAA